MISKSAARKAGSRLREAYPGALVGDPADVQLIADQLAVIEEFRAQFSQPLNSMSNSLRSYLSTCRIDGEVSQRLKRMPTIIDKIVNRESKTDLSRMRDIGGCRVVVTASNPGVLYDLADYVVDRNVGTRVIDYVAEPRPSGYRALHLEVSRQSLPIEVQLRTPAMHRWAETMEAFSDLLGENFKQDGDSDVHKFMALQLELDVLEEQRRLPTRSLLRERAIHAQVISGLLSEAEKSKGKG